MDEPLTKLAKVNQKIVKAVSGLLVADTFTKAGTAESVLPGGKEHSEIGKSHIRV